MTYEQQSAIQKALLDEINNQYDVLDEQLLALAFTSAIETQRRIVELDTLREYVLDLDPESATPDNEPEPEIPETAPEGSIYVVGGGEPMPENPDAPAPEKTDEQIIADAQLEREAILADLAFLTSLGFVRVG